MKAFVSDKKWTEGKSPGKVFPLTVTALEDRDLKVKCVFMSEGKCIELTLLMRKTEEPGQYSTAWGIKLTYIYELPVKDHYILRSEYKLHEVKFYMGKLIGNLD
ncbi:odorant-binding protein 2b-like [Nannospalax galili]|uniref:odorant-binding protein 2b-like n=1 Tax=Nannospalax galili TaxID=1026970 RepID=UPI00111C0C85|nr:odorant-binding protein 2b-like [Nannospalax galili]